MAKRVLIKQKFAGTFDQRFGLVVLVTLLLTGISLVTRMVLISLSVSEIELIHLPGILLIGLFYDLFNAGYFVIPLVVYLWLIPSYIFQKPWHRYVLYGVLTVVIFILLLNAISEFFFWDEFDPRFSFIAVDYLVYCIEVLGDLRQA